MSTNVTPPAGPTQGDIADKLLSQEAAGKSGTARQKPSGDISTIADLATLQAIAAQVSSYRQSLGLPSIKPAQIQHLVAVSTGTDLEKDNALCAFLAKHPEIKTVQPAVFAQLAKMAGALSSADDASTPLALDLLQGVVEFDAHNQDLCARINAILSRPPDTLLAPGLTVGDARVLLAEYLRTQKNQQQTTVNRANRHRLANEKGLKKVAAAKTALGQQESVRRLNQAARAGQALPAPATAAPKSHANTKKKSTGHKTTKTGQGSGATAGRKSRKKTTTEK